MISFIIIGRNEGWKLPLCLKSVFQTIKANALTEYEVIYVDSRSTDDSIENAKKFKKVKIIQLTGNINAAIGRNVGAKESKGDVLFFIDGDMEIEQNFLPIVYQESKGLKYDFVSGQMNYIYLDKNDNYLGEELYYRKSLLKDRMSYTVGGIFLIKREKWFLVGGMRNKYKKGQDGEFALRLAKAGTPLLRKKELIGKTRMTSYVDKTRLYKDIINNLYPRSLLYREHLFNKYVWPSILRNDSSLLLLISIIAFSVIFHKVYFFIFYFLFLVIRILNRNKSIRNLLIRFPHLFLRDIIVLFGIFLFFPLKKNYSRVKYKVIRE